MILSWDKHDSDIPKLTENILPNSNNIQMKFLTKILSFVHKTNCVQSLRSAGWSWSAVREKHCYLTGGWRLELEGCERDSL